MQGQRSSFDSFPESFEFNQGSSSSNTGVEEQLWNNMLNSVETRLPAFILSPSETNITYGNNSSGWNSVEPQSTENARNNVTHDGMKLEDGWSSLGDHAETGSTFEDRRYEPASMLSLGSVNINLSSNHVANEPLVLRNPISDDTLQNINLNEGYEGNSSNGGHFAEASVYPHSPTYPFGTDSGSGGYIVEENDSIPGSSLDGRRLSCKRKALEGASAQASLGGTSSFFQHGSSSSASNLSENPAINSSEQPNPIFQVGTEEASDGRPVLCVAGNGERTQRSFRMRINPTQRLESVQPNLLSAGSARRRSQVGSPQQQSRLQLNAQLGNTSSPQIPSHIIPIPGFPQNVPTFQLNGSSSSRVGSSSNSPAISEDRGVALREQAFSRSISRNILEHPLFVHATEMRNLARDPTNWVSSNGNISIPGNIASTSRIGSSPGIHPSSQTRVPQHNPSVQYPQSLSAFTRQSLFQSAGSDSGGQSSGFPPLHPTPFVSSQETVLSTGVDHQVRHQPYTTRPALWIDRQSNGVLGVPFSLRSGAASEGRSRLVSEIRNVLDLMRRGENLRFEDVLILDQSMVYGVRELHDRHRDMRLDVDNMSYEELLALEERIGNVSTGLSEETITKCLKRRIYSSMAIETPLEVEPCCICQEEYVDGDDLGTLECGHDFHPGCIRKWLMLKNLCPICKTTALVPRQENI